MTRLRFGKMYTEILSRREMEKETKAKSRETLKAFKAILFHSPGKNSTCVLVFRLEKPFLHVAGRYR